MRLNLSLLLAVLCLTASSSWARPPRATRTNGKIVAVDLKTETLHLQTQKDMKRLRWN